MIVTMMCLMELRLALTDESLWFLAIEVNVFKIASQIINVVWWVAGGRLHEERDRLRLQLKIQQRQETLSQTQPDLRNSIRFPRKMNLHIPPEFLRILLDTSRSTCII